MISPPTGRALCGDESGLEPEDCEAFEAFTADMVAEYGQCWAIDCSDEPSFTTYHDAKRYGVLACETLTFTFINGKQNNGS